MSYNFTEKDFTSDEFTKITGYSYLMSQSGFLFWVFTEVTEIKTQDGKVYKKNYLNCMHTILIMFIIGQIMELESQSTGTWSLEQEKVKLVDGALT